ncbi:MAG: Smr/MutS family protein [Halodesulfovibrio sp.]
MSFEDANPFRKLDKKQFKDAENPDGKSAKGGKAAAKSAGHSAHAGRGRQGAAAQAPEPEEGMADFMRAMTGVSRLDGKVSAAGKKSGTAAGGRTESGVTAQGARTVGTDDDEGMFSMADLDEFKAVTKKGASQKLKPSHEESDARQRSRDAVVKRNDEALEEKPASNATEEDTFLQAMEGVSGITSRGRDIRKRPEPVRKGQGAAHAAQALQDLLDGTIEFQLEYSEEFIQGHVTGFDPMVLGKLRSGQYSPEGHLDLHGMVAQEAYDAMVAFMRMAYTKGMRTVLLIPGRGRNSPEGFGVLREKVQHWLTRDPFKRVVLAFCTAQPRDGGAGAVYVMLRKLKKSHGKIQWERTPSDPDLFV